MPRRWPFYISRRALGGRGANLCCVLRNSRDAGAMQCRRGRSTRILFVSLMLSFRWHWSQRRLQQGLTMSIDITFIPNREHVPKYPAVLRYNKQGYGHTQAGDTLGARTADDMRRGRHGVAACTALGYTGMCLLDIHMMNNAGTLAPTDITAKTTSHAAIDVSVR
jgi:hypothetical protein